ncbi:unnamed protein product, partial [marine sediment metagenome]
MGSETSDRGSPETPVIFPAIPWLKNDTIYDGFLESCLSHLKAQKCDDIEILPPVLSSIVTDDEFKNTSQMTLITPKLNELADKFRESEATHILYLNADAEIPSNALRLFLSHDVDVVSGISPPHMTSSWTTVFHWVPPPTPEENWSTPFF